jgi:hypothetical protein
VIELSEMIAELREELNRALESGLSEALRFELGPVELEVTVGVDRGGSASGKVRFMVLELGADGSVTQSSLQRITLTLQPRLVGSATPPMISGVELQGER